MKDIRLSNGELIEVSINWLTLKILNDYGLEKLQSEMKSETGQLEAASVLIYSVLRSNGKKITEEESLSLIPIEDDTIFSIFETFNEKLTVFKKKQESRMNMKKITK